jgi:hypothetical protein
MNIDQIKSIIYDWLNRGNDWHELCEDAESEHKDIDEAWEDASDLAADYIDSDLETLVEYWLDKHGNQIIDMIREKLDAQDPDEDAAVERLEMQVRDMAQDVARVVERGTYIGDELMAFIQEKTEDMARIRKQITEITGEEDDE